MRINFITCFSRLKSNSKFFVRFESNCEIFKSNYKQKTVFKFFLPDSTWKMQQKIVHNFFAYFQYRRRYWSWNTSSMNSCNEYHNQNFDKILSPWKQSKKMFQRKFLLYFWLNVHLHCEITIKNNILPRNVNQKWTFFQISRAYSPSILRIPPLCIWTFFFILTRTIYC